jgi:hypothetical protein
MLLAYEDSSTYMAIIYSPSFDEFDLSRYFCQCYSGLWIVQAQTGSVGLPHSANITCARMRLESYIMGMGTGGH